MLFAKHCDYCVETDRFPIFMGLNEQLNGGRVVIINGKVPHAVLIELFTRHGAGTLIEKD